MEDLFVLFGSLAGVALLIPVLIGIGKKVGLIKDGQSGAWHKGLQVIAFVLVAVVDVFGLNVDLAFADEIAGMVAQVGTLILTLLGMFGVGSTTYELAKNRVPLVGYSFSGK